MSRRTGHVWSEWIGGRCRKCGQERYDGATWTIWCVMKASVRQLLGKRKGVR